MDCSSDAEDAVRSRDGYNYDGYTLRVEFPKNSTRATRGGGVTRSASIRGVNSGSLGCGTGSRGNGQTSRRSDYRVLVSG